MCSWGGSFATEGPEYTERFFLLPSAGRSALFQMGNGLRLCVLCDLCGRNLLTRGRPKSSMAKQDRGRGRYRYRYRRARCHTAQESIPISIGRIGSDCLEAEAEGLCSWGGSFATEGTEFTERFFLLPSAGRSSFYQMGNGLRLCVLCDLCGRNLLTRGRPISARSGSGSISSWLHLRIACRWGEGLKMVGILV